MARNIEGPVGEILIKSNVAIPDITVFRPVSGSASGTGILILPGGAFGALAWDVEGTEIAHWLTERGITAFVVKYRVRPYTLAPGQQQPKAAVDLLRLLEPARKIAVADAMQAVRVVREHADSFGIKSDRIGMIGFSAGAITTMGVILEADPSARPTFAASIYGMKGTDTAVATDAPPLFIAAAQDDPVVPASSSTQIFDQWTAAHRPAELHLYAKGGHGFGMRRRNLPVDHWPDAFEAWLRAQGLEAH